MFLLSGTGDVIEPSEDAIAIGSGGTYAYAAAIAYLDASRRLEEIGRSQGATDITKLPGYFSAREIVQKSLEIASGICIFTNDRIVVEEI